MDGSIQRRGQHSWRITLSMGYDAAGKRIRKFHTVKGTKQDAERRKRELLGAVDKGAPIDLTKESVAQYLNRWLLARVGTIRENTRYGYQRVIERYVIPAIGQHHLTQLQPGHIKQMEADLLMRGISGTTVAQTQRILHRALEDAVAENIVLRNACSGIKAPRKSGKEMQTLNSEQLGRLLDASEQSQYGDLIHLAAHTGLRRGELVGLKWEDIDLDRGVIRVVRSVSRVPGQGFTVDSPKTASGKRAVDIEPEVVSRLHRHRASLAEQHLGLGPAWTDEGWVFPREDGSCQDPTMVSRFYHQLVKILRLPPVRLHDLRHTHATMLLEAGMNFKVVQERLGHSSPAVTLGIYGHVSPSMQREAAGVVGKALRKAKQIA